jgi:UDP-glucose 4-epimerase
MNCVVMGGGGFIGSHLTEALLLRHDRVTVFDKPGAPYLEILLNKGANIILGDFLDPTAVQKALISAETVFHLISTTVPKSSIDNPIFDIETNLIGSINLLNLARNAGVNKIVYASSGGTVYGVPKEIPISEDHPTDPICSYGIIKLAVEKYLRLFWTLSGMNYCILRFSNAYGERQIVNSAQGIISTIIDKELHNKKLTIWGDGSVIRDYIHVSDIVSAFLLASTDIEEPRIFNIGSGIGHSVNDIVNTIESLLGKKIDIVYEPGRAYDVPINILNVSLAKKFLGWEPKKILADGIYQTLDYMRGNK